MPIKIPQDFSQKLNELISSAVNNYFEMFLMLVYFEFGRWSDCALCVPGCRSRESISHAHGRNVEIP